MTTCLVSEEGVVTDGAGNMHYAATPREGIVKALSLCPAGGTVQLGEGTFEVPSQIAFADRSVLGTYELMDNVMVWDGRALAFVKKDNVPVPRTKLLATGSMASSFVLRLSDNTRPVTIAHLDLDGSMSTDGLNARLVMGGIGLYGCKNVMIDHVRTLKFWKHGVYFGDASSVNYVKNSEMGYCGLRDKYAVRRYGNGIVSGSSNSSYTYVQNCHVHHISMHGVNTEPGSHYSVRDCYIETDGVYYNDANSETAPYAVSFGTSSSNYNTIEHCDVRAPRGWGVVTKGGTGKSITNCRIIAKYPTSLAAGTATSGNGYTESFVPAGTEEQGASASDEMDAVLIEDTPEEPIVPEPEPPVDVHETSLDDAPASDDPTDPSSSGETEQPVQETPDEEEGETPTEPSEPGVPSEEPGQDQPPEVGVEEPPVEVEEPPVVDSVTPETPDEEPISPGPTPGTGRNVLVELIQWIFSLFRRKR